MILMEHWINLRRFESGGRRDVALIIDASTSMTRHSGTRTLFEEALEEARRIVKDAPRGTSFVVILGGPSPQALSNTPVSHRTDILAQLDGLQATGGTSAPRKRSAWPPSCFPRESTPTRTSSSSPTASGTAGASTTPEPGKPSAKRGKPCPPNHA